MRRLKLPGANKYKARRCGKYPSISEATRACHLRRCRKEGYLSNLREQVRFIVSPDGWPKIEYICDFMYESDGAYTVEDVKGKVTDVFKIKFKLLKGKFPDIDFRLIKPRRSKKVITHWKHFRTYSKKEKPFFVEKNICDQTLRSLAILGQAKTQ